MPNHLQTPPERALPHPSASYYPNPVAFQTLSLRPSGPSSGLYGSCTLLPHLSLGCKPPLHQPSYLFTLISRKYFIYVLVCMSPLWKMSSLKAGTCQPFVKCLAHRSHSIRQRQAEFSIPTFTHPRPLLHQPRLHQLCHSSNTCSSAPTDSALSSLHVTSHGNP